MIIYGPCSNVSTVDFEQIFLQSVNPCFRNKITNPSVRSSHPVVPCEKSILSAKLKEKTSDVGPNKILRRES